MDGGEMGAWEEDDRDDGGVLREGNEWREEDEGRWCWRWGAWGLLPGTMFSVYLFFLDRLGCLKIFEG